MSDKWFFPLCVVLGCGMLYIAMSPMVERLPSGAMSAAGSKSADLILVENKDLNRLIPGDIGDVELTNSKDGVFLTIGVEAGQFYDVPTFGPYLALASDIEQAFSEKKILITIEARLHNSEVSINSSRPLLFEANYAADSAENSGWQRFELKPEFTTHSFEFTPPDSGKGSGQDFLAIRPFSNRFAHKVDVKTIKFEVMKN